MTFYATCKWKERAFIDFIIDQFALRLKKEGQKWTLSPPFLSTGKLGVIGPTLRLKGILASHKIFLPTVTRLSGRFFMILLRPIRGHDFHDQLKALRNTRVQEANRRSGKV